MLRAFTLIELIAVMVLLSVLAASAVPTLRTISSARSDLAAEEIARALVTGRAHAASTGAPAGVLLNPDAGTIRSVAWIDNAVAPLPLAPDRILLPISLGEAYPGVSITSVDTGAAHNGIWFLESGIPVASDGDDPATADPLSQDAVITLNGGRTITVRRLTGMVSR